MDSRRGASAAGGKCPVTLLADPCPNPCPQRALEVGRLARVATAPLPTGAASLPAGAAPLPAAEAALTRRARAVAATPSRDSPATCSISDDRTPRPLRSPCQGGTLAG
jgi:hypothetical protein